jgi:hypothetical protein
MVTVWHLFLFSCQPGVVYEFMSMPDMMFIMPQPVTAISTAHADTSVLFKPQIIERKGAKGKESFTADC